MSEKICKNCKFNPENKWHENGCRWEGKYPILPQMTCYNFEERDYMKEARLELRQQELMEKPYKLKELLYKEFTAKKDE